MTGVTAQLAKRVIEIEFDDLSSAAVQKTKEILLDSIGCALGGYVTERAKIAIQLGEVFGVKCEATTIGHKKLSTPAASFVNGELINCMDFDVIGPVTAHVAPYVIPSPLAVSEKIEATGKDFITAVAIALEVGGRAVGSLSGHKWPKDEPPYYEEAPRASYNSTIFGAIAAVCKLLGMGEMEMRSAFGIGGTSTPIPGNIKWEYLSEDERNNINLKYGCWNGWVAMLGTVAGLAAQRGFRGDVTILDSEYGYWQMYGSPFFKHDILLGGLGKVWRLEEASFKFYPCCNCNQTGILGISRLVQENNIRTEDIDEIVVYGDPLMQTSIRYPSGIKTNEDAQFANAYLFAKAACYDDPPGPQWHLSSSWKNPKVTNLMPKIKTKVHPKADEIMSGKFKAGGLTVFTNSVVEIAAKGRKFTIEVPSPKGSLDNPMSISELEDKFRHNALYSLVKRDRVEKIIEAILNLDKLDNVTKLTRLLDIDA